MISVLRAHTSHACVDYIDEADDEAVNSVRRHRYDTAVVRAGSYVRVVYENEPATRN